MKASSRIGESLNTIHERTPGFRTLSILEVTAGQGTSIGWRFEQLRGIVDLVDHKRASRLSGHLPCLCRRLHLPTEAGWETSCKNLTQRSVCPGSRFHVNDSRKNSVPARIVTSISGKATSVLRLPVPDERSTIHAVPKILETDKSEDMHEDVENMSLLRSLIRMAA